MFSEDLTEESHPCGLLLLVDKLEDNDLTRRRCSKMAGWRRRTREGVMENSINSIVFGVIKPGECVVPIFVVKLGKNGAHVSCFKRVESRVRHLMEVVASDDPGRELVFGIDED